MTEKGGSEGTEDVQNAVQWSTTHRRIPDTVKSYEFGQELAFSVVGGYTFIEKQGWDNFNEGKTNAGSALT